MVALLGIILQVAGWGIFEKTRFEWKYNEEVKVQIETPTFDDDVKKIEGEEITLTGYFLPISFSKRRIILSKLPMASCFFCGGDAGLESVAEIYFAKEQPRFKRDELLTIRGKLELNDGVDGHLIFIVNNASLVSR